MIERAKAEGVYQGGKRRLDRKKIKATPAKGIGAAAIETALGYIMLTLKKRIKIDERGRDFAETTPGQEQDRLF